MKEERVENLTEKQLISLVSFRRKKNVKLIFSDTIAKCPTCGMPIDIEFINYCSHCGQKLSWKPYFKVMTMPERIQYEYDLLYYLYKNDKHINVLSYLSRHPKMNKNKMRRGMQKLIKKGAKPKK